jgi:DNA-binding transcriptional ArsR family regulator
VLPRGISGTGAYAVAMMTSPDPPARSVIDIDDAARIRALSHPARLAIIDYLGSGVTATATELAEVVGLSPSATSYHLRELARAGLIREAEGRGDGRERVWQGVADRFRYDSDNIDDDWAGRGEAYGLLGALLAWQDAQAQRYYADLPQMPREWQDASAIYGSKIVATAAELQELAREVRRLCERYQQDARQAPEGAETVAVIFRALPRLADQEAARSGTWQPPAKRTRAAGR